MGNTSTARINNHILRARDRKKPAYKKEDSGLPVCRAYPRQKEKATSKRPERIRRNQCMDNRNMQMKDNGCADSARQQKNFPG